MQSGQLLYWLLGFNFEEALNDNSRLKIMREPTSRIVILPFTLYIIHHNIPLYISTFAFYILNFIPILCISQPTRNGIGAAEAGETAGGQVMVDDKSAHQRSVCIA